MMVLDDEHDLGREAVVFVGLGHGLHGPRGEPLFRLVQVSMAEGSGAAVLLAHEGILVDVDVFTCVWALLESRNDNATADSLEDPKASSPVCLRVLLVGVSVDILQSGGDGAD
jgi:hypothetical protein